MKKLKSGRNPGRPKNTGRHQANDALFLPQIADRRLAHPHQPIAVIIRGLVDTERDTGGVRRLQRAFKAQNPGLMAAAMQRRQQQQIQKCSDQLVLFAKGVRQVRDTFAGKLEAWGRSPEGQRAVEVINRFQKAANSPEVRKWLALSGSDARLRHMS
jgi:hypothetical protein